MFTGIVEEVGRLGSVEPFEGGLRIRVEAEAVVEGLRDGDSIALNGVCQTVVGSDRGGFWVEAIGTTLGRTTLGSLAPGTRVNLERALALGDRLGGHLVQGHVDAVGEVLALERQGEHVLLRVSLPEEVADVTVLHGSIAIDGVSLTVNRLLPGDVAEVALIPYTWEHTALAGRAVGDAVNLEGDMVGRFVVQYMKRRGGIDAAVEERASAPAGGSGHAF